MIAVMELSFIRWMPPTTGAEVVGVTLRFAELPVFLLRQSIAARLVRNTYPNLAPSLPAALAA